MTVNVYRSRLTPRELIIKMLNEKNNTIFGLNDFIWHSDNIVYETVNDKKLCTHEYRVSHVNQKCYPGEYIIKIDELSSSDYPVGEFTNYDFNFVPGLPNQPNELLPPDGTLKTNQYSFGVTEAIELLESSNGYNALIDHILKVKIIKSTNEYPSPIIYNPRIW